jgi:hypothetical protein
MRKHLAPIGDVLILSTMLRSVCRAFPSTEILYDKERSKWTGLVFCLHIGCKVLIPRGPGSLFRQAKCHHYCYWSSYRSSPAHDCLQRVS